MFENEQYCKLRNEHGSEHGTCDCGTPDDCPLGIPIATPVKMRMAITIDRFLAKVEERYHDH